MSKDNSVYLVSSAYEISSLLKICIIVKQSSVSLTNRHSPCTDMCTVYIT